MGHNSYFLTESKYSLNPRDFRREQDTIFVVTFRPRRTSKLRALAPIRLRTAYLDTELTTS